VIKTTSVLQIRCYVQISERSRCRQEIHHQARPTAGHENNRTTTSVRLMCLWLS